MSITETNLTITNRVGLHARPARLLVQTAAQYQSQIQLRRGDKTANAKSIVGVLKLGAVMGDTLVLHAEDAEGEDAEKALDALTNLALRNFDEQE